MSLTRGNSTSNYRSPSTVIGIGPSNSKAPNFTKGEIETCERSVRKTREITGDLQPLVSYLLHEAHLGPKGLLGGVLVPFGEKNFTTTRGESGFWVESTVPVWIIQEPGTSRKKYLSTRALTRWISDVNTSDWTQKTRSSRRRAPPPSSAGSAEGTPPRFLGRGLTEGSTYLPPVSEEDSVSNWGSQIPASVRSGLSLAEARYRETPKRLTEEGYLFDNDEFFRRFDALNLERQKAGLGEIQPSVTPSVYHR